MRTPTPYRLVISVALLAMLAVPALYAGDGVIRKKPHAVKDEYIVVLRSDLEDDKVNGLAHALASSHGSRVEKVWTAALNGFFVRMPAGRAEALSRHPLVEYVEENAETFTSAATMPTNVDPANCNLPGQQNCVETPDNRLWHLDRVDQDSAVPSKTYSYVATGSGVTVYVVDLGVEGDHTEFLRLDGTSRVTTGINASGDPFPANDPCGGPPAPGLSGIDEDQYLAELNVSHGTGTASLAAGKKIGVAKEATIVPVKVARCDRFKSRYRVANRYYNVGERVYDKWSVSNTLKLHKHWVAIQAGTASGAEARDWYPAADGTFADGPTLKWLEYQPPAEFQTAQMLITGLDGIITHRRTLPPPAPAVATISVYELINTPGVLEGSNGPSSVQQSIQSVIAEGITVVASANNKNQNACNYAPAAFSRTNPDLSRRGSVITVGGSMLLNDPGAPSYDATQPTRDGRWICTSGCLEPGSNGGPCVTLFAPARNITPAFSRTSTDYRDFSSGTSWSAPIVAGVVARHLQFDSGLTPEQVHARLLNDSLVGVLDAATLDTPGVPAGSTPNRFLRAGDVRITTQPQDTGSSASTPAVLSVNVTGVLPLTYQWFRVNSDFTPTGRRGAAASVLMVGEQSPVLSVQPSATTGYWVRVSGDGAADSDIAYVTPSLAAPPPAGLIADTNPDRTVTVSWTSTSADAYVVERKLGTAAWASLTVVTSTSHVDSTIPVGAIALYRVRSRMNGSPPNDSAPSNVDFGHGWTLTDPVLTSALTPIRAAHLTELRTILNQLADAASLLRPPNGPYAYSDQNAQLSALQNQIVDDGHFTDLMARINAVRQAPLFQIPQAGFQSNPQPNTAILKTQIEDLRGALR